MRPDQYSGDLMGDLSARRGPHRGQRIARPQRDHQGAGAAGGNADLRDGPDFHDAGAGQLLDGVFALRLRAGGAGRKGNRHAQSYARRSAGRRRSLICKLVQRGPARTVMLCAGPPGFPKTDDGAFVPRSSCAVAIFARGPVEIVLLSSSDSISDDSPVVGFALEKEHPLTRDFAK